MAIHCNSDYVQHFALVGRRKVPIALPNTATIEIQLVKTGTDETHICTVANGRVQMNDFTLGKFSLELDAVYTATMIPGDYQVVCHRTDQQRTRLFTGLVKVKAAS